MSSDDIECPVDFIPIDNNKIRVIALMVCLLAIEFWFQHFWFVFAVLGIDFALRAFNLQKLSPLAFIAGAIVKQLHIKSKIVDQAPKRFAARMGFSIIVIIFAFHFLQLTILVNIMVLMLIFFSFLESFFGICIGCHVYTYWQRLGRMMGK